MGDDYNGAYAIRVKDVELIVISSNGGGWDHVSVQGPGRTPTWEEMQAIKELFFHDDEMAVQFHPIKKNYVNAHPHVLHLWRSQTEKMPVPPLFMV